MFNRTVVVSEQIAAMAPDQREILSKCKNPKRRQEVECVLQQAVDAGIPLKELLGFDRSDFKVRREIWDRYMLVWVKFSKLPVLFDARSHRVLLELYHNSEQFDERLLLKMRLSMQVYWLLSGLDGSWQSYVQKKLIEPTEGRGKKRTFPELPESQSPVGYETDGKKHKGEAIDQKVRVVRQAERRGVDEKVLESTEVSQFCWGLEDKDHLERHFDTDTAHNFFAFLKDLSNFHQLDVECDEAFDLKRTLGFIGEDLGDFQISNELRKRWYWICKYHWTQSGMAGLWSGPCK